MKAYQATFFTFGTIASVKSFYSQAWSVSLLACSYLVNTPHWSNSDSSNSEKHPTDGKFFFYIFCYFLIIFL